MLLSLWPRDAKVIKKCVWIVFMISRINGILNDNIYHTIEFYSSIYGVLRFPNMCNHSTWTLLSTWHHYWEYGGVALMWNILFNNVVMNIE